MLFGSACSSWKLNLILNNAMIQPNSQRCKGRSNQKGNGDKGWNSLKMPKVSTMYSRLIKNEWNTVCVNKTMRKYILARKPKVILLIFSNNSNMVCQKNHYLSLQKRYLLHVWGKGYTGNPLNLSVNLKLL